MSVASKVGRPMGLPKTYPVVDRITNVNTMLCDANGYRRLLISPHCKRLIRALDTLTYKPDTRIPDKSTGQDHITDALGYLVVAAFPLIRSEVRIMELRL